MLTAIKRSASARVFLQHTALRRDTSVVNEKGDCRVFGDALGQLQHLCRLRKVCHNYFHRPTGFLSDPARIGLKPRGIAGHGDQVIAALR
jgi:hypothetical protein